MSLTERTRAATGTKTTRTVDDRVAKGGVELVPEAREDLTAAQRMSLIGERARVSGRTRGHDEVIARVHARISTSSEAERATPEALRTLIGGLVGQAADELRLAVTTNERRALVEAIFDDITGLGPLEPLVNDPEITDILVNGPDKVYVEREAHIEKTGLHFESGDHLMRVIDRIVSRVGRRVDESAPMADARLDTGARVNVVLPPLALNGPILTIRKFSRDPLQIEDLIRFGSLTEDMVEFLSACVRARFNVVVSGGGSSGKTTMLNILSSFIPEDERIVTIEDSAELQLRQVHVVPLETRPANIEGRGLVSIRDLVINALRMRPDRIVVGECRGAEALDMLQAMNTGHDGSLTTMHANSPADAINRIEVMILMAGNDLPSKAIREQIASALHVFVHMGRMRDGTRKVTHVSEVLGYDGLHVRLQEIFRFHQTGTDADGRVHGVMGPTGKVPACLDELAVRGQHVDPAIFSTTRRI